MFINLNKLVKNKLRATDIHVTKLRMHLFSSPSIVSIKMYLFIYTDLL